MKITIIVLASLAVVLGIVAYFAVFSGSELIVPNPAGGTQSSAQGGTGTSTPLTFISSSSSTSADSSSSATSTAVSNQIYQMTFSAPYPVTWNEGQPQFAVTGITLQGNQLSIAVNVQTGASAQCVPVNLRLITDEQGDMAAPSAPNSPNFPLAADGTCTAAANTSYPNQVVMFEVDPAQTPFLVTTGGTSNVFFEVTTSTDNGLQIIVPQSSG